MSGKIALRFAANDEDILVMEELAKNAHFDLGFHDRRLHWLYSPKTHILILDNTSSEVIGYFTGNFVRQDIFLRAHTYIKKEYRSKHTLFDILPTWDAMMGVPADANLIYNCNGITLKALVRPNPGYVISEKMLSYEGNIHHSILRQFERPPDVTVRLIQDAHDLQLLLAYDKTIHYIADRESFMRQWCSNDGVNATTAIALSSTGICLGFASLRRAVNLIEPAYGESDAIGLALLSAVLLTLREDEVAQITFPGSHSTVLAFCAALGWTSCMTEHRVYSLENILLPWTKVFAVQDFFAV
uniref:YitH acetyltransferase (GNAT) domain-containing protein n=1 Tax=Plectus sambesii TaxID=2011161 RepID=A0A914UYK1_9BILA